MNPKILTPVALFCVLATLQAAPSAIDYANVDLSNYMLLCSRSDPQRDECFRQSFQQFANTQSSGVRELAIPQFEPLLWKNLRFSFASPLVPLSSLVVTNLKIVGLSQTKVVAVKTKFTENEMRAKIDIEIPNLFIEGTYKGEPRYAQMNYIPRGYFNSTTENNSATLRVAGRTEVRNGETYMIMRKFNASPKIGNPRMYVDGLFPDPALDQIATQLFNNNVEVLLNATMNEMVAIMEPQLLREVNKFFTVIPYRNMFPREY